MVTYKEWMKNGYLKKFWNGANREEKTGKTLKVVAAGCRNWDAREGNLRVMDSQRRMSKENKNLGTDRYENIYTLYIHKIIIIIIITIICICK